MCLVDQSDRSLWTASPFALCFVRTSSPPLRLPRTTTIEEGTVRLRNARRGQRTLLVHDPCDEHASAEGGDHRPHCVVFVPVGALWLRRGDDEDDDDGDQEDGHVPPVVGRGDDPGAREAHAEDVVGLDLDGGRGRRGGELRPFPLRGGRSESGSEHVHGHDRVRPREADEDGRAAPGREPVPQKRPEGQGGAPNRRSEVGRSQERVLDTTGGARVRGQDDDEGEEGSRVVGCGSCGGGGHVCVLERRWTSSRIIRPNKNLKCS